jgi:CHAT domain-containing protein
VQEVAALWSGQDAEGASPTGANAGTSGGGRESLVLTGAEATETAFKRLAPQQQVLHVASHGFFLDDRCVGPAGPHRGIGSLTVSDSTTVESLVQGPTLSLSGIALAGANHRAAARDGEDDGILTAEEILLLPLSGVEWVVLSACETGVGEVRSTEGVFGLRRAFRIAGARTLIMSLWAVEDTTTREWMAALYEARFESEMETAEAVRHATRTVLDHRRTRGESTHPFWWAGFVATGDWR